MSRRRNQITHTDAIAIGVVAVAAGVLGALAGCEPTGNAVPDAIITFGLGAFVTWLGASSPWWALTTGAGVAGIAASTGQTWVVLIAWASMLAAAAIGTWRLNRPIVRAAIAGAVVQVVFRIEWDPFFLSSAIVAGAILALIAITGWERRRRFVRKRVMWSSLGVVGVAAIASLGFGVAALGIRGSATDGYRSMLLALELIERGDLPGATDALREASEELGEAGDAFDSPLTQPARIVPGVAQNRDITAGVMRGASDAATAAGNALDTVDLDRLRIVDGVIDIAALEALEPSLAELETTVLELRDVLEEARSPWLVGPLASRLDTARVRADQVAVQSVASHAAAQVAPGLLGADGERRYVIAFTNPAESRGHSGLMGNWSEMTITNGRIELTESGRTGALERGLDAAQPVALDMPAEYLDHYTVFGAGGAEGPVNRKWFVNGFISPDTPSVAEVFRQMYGESQGRDVDGVIIMDPTAIAGLLRITGPVELDTVDTTLSADNAVEFLTLDQYQFAENEREDLLAAATSLTVEALLESTLPPPQELGAILGPAATEGHLSAWSANPEEQRLLELVGMDAAMPQLDDLPQSDALAVTANNGNGNKIDSFLEREIVYRPQVDEPSGSVIADLELAITNNAPTSGYADYVINNIREMPIGTNRMVVEIWTALEVIQLELNGKTIPPAPVREFGWNIYSLTFRVPSGETASITAKLAGQIEPGDYELIFRPQPLPNPDVVSIDVRTGGGSQVIDYEGTPLRRTLFTRDSADAWRPRDHPARR